MWLNLNVKFIFVLFCGLLSFQGCSTFNPATGQSEYILVPTDAEVIMGWDVHAQIMHQQSESKRTADVERLRRIGYQVAQVSDRQDYEYHFYLIESDQLNAYTTPGGYVYMFTGLYDRLTSDDQLAAVLAHEIGHCAARHVVKKFQASLGYSMVSQMIFGQVQDEVARRIVSLGGDALMNLAMASYGRQDELQADQLGVKYLHLAGYQEEALIETFQILQKHSDGPHKGDYFSTHPSHEERIELIKKEIAQVRQTY